MIRTATRATKLESLHNKDYWQLILMHNMTVKHVANTSQALDLANKYPGYYSIHSYFC